MGIVLIGYRGSGKTTVGRLLARQMGWSFVDLDESIVQTAGMTIKEIFEKLGETEFRRIEAAALAAILPRNDHVISLGGGAVLAPANRSAIAKSGHHVFYLSADPAELHRRIQADPATATARPHLTGLGGGIEEITTLLANRDPIYRQIMTTEISVNGKTPEQVAAEANDQVTRLQIPVKSQTPIAKTKEKAC